LTSEEHLRREEEEKPRREEPRESRNVSEPAEAVESEDPGVVVPGILGEEPMEDLAEEPSAEEALPEKEKFSERPSEILQEEIPSRGEEISVLMGELELARKERDEYLSDMRRMKAELENSRKRQEKERARFVQLASERLVRELLPVLDNLERALEAEGDIREGVRATLEQLVAILGREGLAPLFSDGENFDPAFHEAVMSQPSDEHEEDTIIRTLERGYTLNGKPIRPAKVIVAK
jgi:molecular chaperone GrpE